MVAEIISRVERRRRWSLEEKLAIMVQALEPGATVTSVADRNGVCRSQLYAWLRLAREGQMPGLSVLPQASPFVPVRVEPSQVPQSLAKEQAQFSPSACDQRAAQLSRGRRPATVEITLTNGRIVKVDECIDPQTLGSLLAVLEGGRSC